MRRPLLIMAVILVGIATFALLINDKPSFDTSLYKRATSTVFWIGETAAEDNDHIANDKSAWDSFWVESYGGVDSPYDRCGFRPCAFVPKENPFYVALPYNDLNRDDTHKDSSYSIPWFEKAKNKTSVVKNRWVEIRSGDKVCYGQWEDVGPFESDDFDYVFGDSDTPKNTLLAKAGIDISPAIRDCLGAKTNIEVYWRFVEYYEVPPGPWNETSTASDVHHW